MSDDLLTHLPAQAVCPACGRIRVAKDDAETARYLAARGLRYYDPAAGRMINRGVPMCECGQPPGPAAQALRKVEEGYGGNEHRMD